MFYNLNVTTVCRFEVFCCYSMLQRMLSGVSFGLCHSVSWLTNGEE